MKKKTLVFGIIILFLGISLAPLTQGINIKEAYYPRLLRAILYVGGSGPNNYTKIQDAIDDASNGDTVFVYDDSSPYYENVIVNKTINLIGEEKHSTIIDANFTADPVFITADWVNFSGFRLRNSGTEQYDSGIDLRGNFTNIFDNIIDPQTNYYSICLQYASNNNISRNLLVENSISIRYKSENNTIYENNFNECGLNIRSDSHHNLVKNNTLNSGRIGLSNSGNWNTIINNSIFNGSIYVGSSDYNLVLGNTINPFEDDYGIRIYYGAFKTLVYDNLIMNGVLYGIHIQECEANIVTNNYIINNENGILIDYYANRNIITYNNIISNSEYGIKIRDPNRPSENNTIYHNNFIDNTWNGYDVCDNYWYNTSIHEGNYWDDYTGNDSDGDGIGDIPYSIHAGPEEDCYPLMYPWGEQRPVANYTYMEEYGGFIFNASSSYDRDGSVVSYEWDFGDGTIEEGIVVSHAYNETGTYDITLSVTDDEGYKGNLSITIDADKNFPPETPSIDGPDSGRWGKPNYFTFQSLDIEGSDVWYFVDWGDGKDTGWMGPFVSGDEISDPHTWSSQDTYIVRCKAKDIFGIQSDWSEHEITIPRNRAILNSLLSWFLERFLLLERLLNLIRLISTRHFIDKFTLY